MLNVNNHDPSPQNTRRLIRAAGLNQKTAAAALGIGYSTVKKYVATDGYTPLVVQLALEMVVINAIN